MSSGESDRAPSEPTVKPAAIVLAFAALAACWLLLMPPGSGPDEGSHVTRSGAVIRGEWQSQNRYSLPDRYQVAEAGCYAFQPAVPASCAVPPEHVGATLELSTTAGAYPVWGHLWYGAFTVIPGLDAVWWARVGGAAVAVGLVAWAAMHAHRRTAALAAGLLVGLTPMAWSTFGTVNPSTFVIAGATALWIGLLVGFGELPQRWDHRWLVAIGWAVLVLPRRDGLVWACLTLVIALALTGRSFDQWRRDLGTLPLLVIGISSAATMIWGITSDSRSSQLVVVAPLAIVAAELWRWWWHRPIHTTATRAASIGVAGIVGLLATYVVIDTRPGGWNTNLAIDVIMQTDENLIEAIGVLGWLDTVVPAFVVYAWVLAIGVLVGGVLLVGARATAAWAAVLAATTVFTSWVLELVQGNASGLYWQGRYSLPLLVGIPLVLALPLDRLGERLHDLRWAVGGLGLVILNVAAWSAARRFGVGVNGSLLPWRWDTTIQPVEPLILLIVHLAATVWLASLLLTGRQPVDAAER